MKPFVINRYGRIVFPFNFFPELDFSAFQTLEQFAAVIKRDFEEKAPNETDILQRVESQAYKARYEILRDLALHLFWVNRYAMTMYEKRPTRWRDVARHRDDIFLPVFEPRDGSETTAAIEGRLSEPARHLGRGHRGQDLPRPPRYPPPQEVGGRGAPRHQAHGGRDPRQSEEPHLSPARLRSRLSRLRLRRHHRVQPPRARSSKPLMRQTMVLHNQYRWDRSKLRLTEVGRLHDDDYVVVFHPRSDDVLHFIRRVKGMHRVPRRKPVPAESRRPVLPYPPVQVRERFKVMPKLEAVAVYKGERPCTNDDLIRNAAYCWSPMTAAEILRKTGIEERLYTELDLDHMALLAAQRALEKSRHRPEEIGAVIFCSCTSVKMMPSLATWLSGQLGIFQTHASCDIVAACAGLPYGLSEAVRLLQEVERPILVVCGEKFSDKIGTVRTSRMIFGDGAAALVIAPAPAGAAPTSRCCRRTRAAPCRKWTRSSGPIPSSTTTSRCTGRRCAPSSSAISARCWTSCAPCLIRTGRAAARSSDAVDLVVPHQANKTMVVSIAEAAGVSAERLYFNIDKVGNTSSASIPDRAARRGEGRVIDRPMRIFAPGFGAGAVGGYAVLRVDPAVVA